MLYFLSPDVTYYAGMSGVLYGVAIYGALASFRAKPCISSGIIGYVLIKLLMHDWINHFMAVDQVLSNVPVVEDIHWYGAEWGLLFFIILNVSTLFTGGFDSQHR
jgi:hypothetical protein